MMTQPTEKMGDVIELQSEQLWLVPSYYGHFHCKGGACRNSCCGGWNISVGMEEYFRLIGLDCSEELHRRLECAFHPADEPSPERYALITPNWLGDCPMHDEDGLCRLHRECGEETLPDICRLYPRSIKRENERHGTCVCSNSCEAVVEMLMAENEPLSFCEESLAISASLPEPSDPRLPEIRSACLSFLERRTLALPDRLRAIGRLLTAVEAGGSPDPEQIGEKAELSHPFDIQAFSAIMRMLTRMSENSPALQCFGVDSFSRYKNGDEAAAALYRSDIRRFEALFPDWERIFENVLVNHLFYEDFPFIDKRLTIYGEYIGLTAVYAALRVMCAGYMSTREKQSDLADIIAGLFRCVEHAPFYFNADFLLERAEQGGRASSDGALTL